MNKKYRVFNFKQKEKGQSFIELILVFSVLLMLLAGMVEFGNLLNQYINIIDGAREGARFGSNDDPYSVTNGVDNYEPFFAKIYEIIQGKYDSNGVQLSKGAINPIILSKANGDDIVVTFFSVTKGSSYLDRHVSAAGSRYNNHVSQYSNDSQILDLIDGTAPSTGILLVEIFYSYNQILKLFSFTGIPDPINVHAYSVMPLSSVEPTPVPSPTP